MKVRNKTCVYKGAKPLEASKVSLGFFFIRVVSHPLHNYFVHDMFNWGMCVVTRRVLGTYFIGPQPTSAMDFRISCPSRLKRLFIFVGLNIITSQQSKTLYGLHEVNEGTRRSALALHHCQRRMSLARAYTVIYRISDRPLEWVQLGSSNRGRVHKNISRSEWQGLRVLVSVRRCVGFIITLKARKRVRLKSCLYGEIQNNVVVEESVNNQCWQSLFKWAIMYAELPLVWIVRKSGNAFNRYPKDYKANTEQWWSTNTSEAWCGSGWIFLSGHAGKGKGWYKVVSHQGPRGVRSQKKKTFLWKILEKGTSFWGFRFIYDT